MFKDEIKFIGQLEENIGTDYYDVVFKSHFKIHHYSEGVYSTDGHIIIGLDFMELSDWKELRKECTMEVFDIIYSFFKKFDDCYNIPEEYMLDD